MFRARSLFLSLSMLAGTAIPAMAQEGPRQVRVERQLDRLDAAEQRELARHDAALDALEWRRLDAQLRRQGVTGRRAAYEFARLAEKQHVRHAENVAFLEAKQRRRGTQNLADAQETRRDRGDRPERPRRRWM